jgi:two-component system sensor histidine kinase KdpD
MLDEGWRRHERGTDVVVGYVETHGRARTHAQLRNLEIIPRRHLTYRDTTVEEMDLDAVLARHPTLALVDELAHTNTPGSRHPKRWQDIETLLDAGIDVITTVNIQHLESLNDVVEHITGIQQRETVPDHIVRHADQIELVDMSPEALRRRMAHGNIYPPERVDAALANYFRPGNLAALRELTLLWLADRVDEGLHRYMDAHAITDTWETRERVIVAITGAGGGEQLIRRAARIAGRLHGTLIGVHVTTADGLHTRTGPNLTQQRHLLEDLGGTYREIIGEDVAAALAGFARAEQATLLLVGTSGQSRWSRLVNGSIIERVSQAARGFDVHVITAEPGADAPLPPPRAHHPRAMASLPLRRQVAAGVLAAVSLPLLTAVLLSSALHVSLPSDLLLFLVLTIAVSALGGMTAGILTALVASLLLIWYFIPPVHDLTISDPDNVVAIVVFVAVAIVVSLLVDRAASRARDANRARAEAEVLARSTATLVGEHDPRRSLLDQLRVTFAFDGVAILTRRDDAWEVEVSAGADPPTQPADGERWDLDGDDTTVLVLRGGERRLDDQRLLRSFLSQLALALQRGRLQAAAAETDRLAATDALRTALLQAVSHDLRTPLASIKASATSLLQPDVRWSPAQRREFIEAIDDETDRLNRVVGNLLDMSRLQADAVQVLLRPVYLEEVVAQALSSIGEPKGVEVAIPDAVPAVSADPMLLERAVANVVANARAWSPPGATVTVEAGRVGPRVHMRVIDRGPGIAAEHREDVFEPFRRLGDRSTQVGAGLGLAVARGFVRAQGGDIVLDDTSGGGLTVVFELATAP